jgi:hypothetical protein
MKENSDPLKDAKFNDSPQFTFQNTSLLVLKSKKQEKYINIL